MNMKYTLIGIFFLFLCFLSPLLALKIEPLGYEDVECFDKYNNEIKEQVCLEEIMPIEYHILIISTPFFYIIGVILLFVGVIIR